MPGGADSGRFHMAYKGRFVCHILGSVCQISCRNPLILRELYAILTPSVWYIFGASFLQIWGVGVVRIVFKNLSFRSEVVCGGGLWSVVPYTSF